MNRLGDKLRLLHRALAGLGLVVAPFLGAQTPGLPPTPTSSNSIPAAPLPPPLPSAKSPVALFRELLAMNPAERRQFLTSRPLATQKMILAKLKEYESFPADQRELRLRATELHWYLWPVLHAPAASHATQLAAIPAENRALVEERLQRWDNLPPELQQELLAHEAAIRYFTDLATSTEQQKSNILKNLSPAHRETLEAGIRQVQAMPEDQRQRLLNRFDQFFNLTPREQADALSTLSEPERRQIDRTLQTFQKLAPAQRVQCIRSFEKFTQLSLAERQQFLKNAERWESMPPDQRQAWRKLVANLAHQPPPPPGRNSPPMPPPPPPPVPRASRPAGSLATNQN
jgi:hypothetical protein